MRKPSIRMALGLCLLYFMSVIGPAAAKPTQDPGDQWIVLSQETWIPVIDDIHQEFYLAYQSITAKSYAQASEHLKKAAKLLDKEAKSLPKDSAAKATGAAAEINALATESAKGKMTVQEFREAMARAYRADVEARWVVVENTEVSTILDHPGEHMASALEEFKAKQYVKASNDLRRASAYVALVVGYDKQTRTLNKLAQDLDNKNYPTYDDFENKIIEVSRTLAGHSLDRARRTTGKLRQAHLDAATSHATLIAKHRNASSASIMAAVAKLKTIKPESADKKAIEEAIGSLEKTLRDPFKG